MMAATLGFANPSTCVLDLANARVEEMGMQRTTAATLGFANPSACVLDLANGGMAGPAKMGTLGCGWLGLQKQGQ